MLAALRNSKFQWLNKIEFYLQVTKSPLQVFLVSGQLSLLLICYIQGNGILFIHQADGQREQRQYTASQPQWPRKDTHHFCSHSVGENESCGSIQKQAVLGNTHVIPAWASASAGTSTPVKNTALFSVGFLICLCCVDLVIVFFKNYLLKQSVQSEECIYYKCIAHCIFINLMYLCNQLQLQKQDITSTEEDPLGRMHF